MEYHLIALGILSIEDLSARATTMYAYTLILEKILTSLLSNDVNIKNVQFTLNLHSQI